MIRLIAIVAAAASLAAQPAANTVLHAARLLDVETGNIVSPGELSLATLGIAPQAVEAILPTYLDRFRRGGWYERPRAV